MPPSKKRSSGIRTPSKKKYKSLSIPRGVRSNPTGFPKQLKVSHRYYDPLVATLASGTASFYTSFRCNGMYDPRHAVGGHQPSYFDQMSALYNHWVVTKASIVVSFAAPTATSLIGCGIAIEDDASIGNDNLSQFIERPGTKTKHITVDDGVVNVYQTWSLEQNFGKGAASASIYRGNSGADPTEQQYFTIFARGINSTEASTIQMGVNIIYEAEWRELKEQLQS